MRYQKIIMLILCLMVVDSVGFADNRRNGNMGNQVKSIAQDTISKEDLEIIKNLELLQNLDVVQNEDITLLENYDDIANMNQSEDKRQ